MPWRDPGGGRDALLEDLTRAVVGRIYRLLESGLSVLGRLSFFQAMESAGRLRNRRAAPIATETSLRAFV